MQLESQGLLNAHMQNHEQHKPKSDLLCQICDEEFMDKKKFEVHMKYKHEDDSWPCNDCDFQASNSPILMKHLKETGHQPSKVCERRQADVRKCYTCQNEFEGYKSLMNHRSNDHPSNKICRNLPYCKHGENCWYVHPGQSQPDLSSQILDENQPLDTQEQRPQETQEKRKCNSCGKEFNGKYDLMNHRKIEHTSNIMCRDWLKSNCRRTAQDCWYNHSMFKPQQPTNQQPQPNQPMEQDFPQLPFKTHPPDQTTLMQMINKMALQLTTIEVQINNTKQQMHRMQTILK